MVGPKQRKRVEAETNSLKRARDGSAFVRCEECKKDVPVVLIDMHSCSLEAKIKLNLEAQVVEKVAEVKKKAPEVKKKPSEKKNTATDEPKPKKTRRLRKVKDPNMPKRPSTAFFLFMDDFRKEYKEANPDSKGVAVVAKEGGEKWKAMTDEEKKPYVDKVSELKAEYEKAMETYNAENGEEEEGRAKEPDVELIDDDDE